jgi:hypothetical protein
MACLCIVEGLARQHPHAEAFSMETFRMAEDATRQREQLDPATIVAINEYIGQKIERWGKWLGIANLAATATLIEGFKQQIDQTLDARMKAETAKSNAEAASATIDEAKTLLQQVKRQDIQDLKRLIDLLHSDTVQAAAVANAIMKLDDELKKLKAQKEQSVTTVRLSSRGPLKPDQPDVPLLPTPQGAPVEIPGSDGLPYCAITAFWNKTNEEYCNLSRGANGRWSASVSGRVICKAACLGNP